MSEYILIVKTPWQLEYFCLSVGDVFHNFKPDKDWNSKAIDWYLITPDERDVIKELKTKLPGFYGICIDQKIVISLPKKLFYKVPNNKLSKLLYI